MTLPVLILLLGISTIGLVMGIFYYTKPRQIVHRRVKKQHWDVAKTDEEFRKWLNLEIDTQVKRTRRMGLVVIVIEALCILLILGLWSAGAGK